MLYNNVQLLTLSQIQQSLLLLYMHCIPHQSLATCRLLHAKFCDLILKKSVHICRWSWRICLQTVPQVIQRPLQMAWTCSTYPTCFVHPPIQPLSLGISQTTHISLPCNTATMTPHPCTSCISRRCKQQETEAILLVCNSNSLNSRCRRGAGHLTWYLKPWT